MMPQLKRGMTEASLCLFICVRVCTGDGRQIEAPTQRRKDIWQNHSSCNGLDGLAQVLGKDSSQKEKTE